ncbi:hypothetical protein O9993_15760 [Vibrio lentus]|nr:hypothetical protein [Vibrio lentus]
MSSAAQARRYALATKLRRNGSVTTPILMLLLNGKKIYLNSFDSGADDLSLSRLELPELEVRLCLIKRHRAWLLKDLSYSRL